MDADASTAAATTSKEDAVSSKEIKTSRQDESACSSMSIGGIQNKDNDTELKVKSGGNGNAGDGSKGSQEEADELLEKIEEVVKGDITTLKDDVDEISQASEQDFLKKIDEEMKETSIASNALSPKISKDNCDLTRRTQNEKENKNNDKSQLDGVIVNNEIFVIDDDDDDDDKVSNKTEDIDEIEQIREEIEKSQKEECEISSIKSGDNSETIKDISISVTSDKSETKDNSNLENVAVDKSKSEQLSDKILTNDETSKTLVNQESTEIKTSSQPSKVESSIASASDEKSNIGCDNTSQKRNEMPMRVETSALPQQKLLDLSAKIEEPMCVDSSESSNDGKMEIDAEEKIEMDVDNGNDNVGTSSIIYNDEEMKSVEKKEIPTNIETQQQLSNQQSQNIVEVLSSPTKLQQDNTSSVRLASTKENLVEITVKVNVETTSPSKLNQCAVTTNSDDKTKSNEIKAISKDNIINNPLEISNVNNEKNLNSSKENEKQIDEVKSNEPQATHNKVKAQSNTEILQSEVKSKIVSNEVLAPKSPLKEISKSPQKINSEFKQNPKIEIEKQDSLSKTVCNEEQKPKDSQTQETVKNEKKSESPISKKMSEMENISTKISEVADISNEINTSVTDTSITDISITTTANTNELPPTGGGDSMKIENKLLSKMKANVGGDQIESGRSSINSPIPPQGNVFNSTPIVKQFEISSENVSKISDALEHDHNTSEHITTNTSESTSGQAKRITSSSTISDTGSGFQSSETDNQSSDAISKFINSIKNGIADSTTDDGGAATSNLKVEESTSRISELAADKVIEDNMYEVNLWYEKNDIKFLSIKRLEKCTSAAVTATAVAQSDSLSSGQGSSNGSVSSLPQFSLPSQRSATIAALSSSGSTTESTEKNTDFAASSIGVNKTKHLIKGLSELCAFMINHFTEIRSNLPGFDKTEDPELMGGENNSGRGKKRKLSTPSSKAKTSSSGRDSAAKRVSSRHNQQRQSQSPAAISDSSSPVSKEGRSSKMSCESPLSIGGKSGAALNETPSRKTESRSRKRSIGKVISDDDDDDGKPKAKQAKKAQQNIEKQIQHQGQGDGQNLGLCVLAKWVDRKYYAGRILEAKPGNKFEVLFEDGATKVLPKDFVVFGNDDGTLPLKDRKIHALVDDDYESGVVISIDKIDNKVFYTVKAETSTVKVTASDIYLSDDQVKIIQLLQNSQVEPPGGGIVHDLTNTSLLDTSLSSTTRHTRHKRISPITTSAILPSMTTTATTVGSGAAVSPEPGTSAAGAKKGGKRQKRWKASTATFPIRISESSDITDTSTQSGEESDLEIVEGVQQEYQKTPREIQDQKMIFIYEYRSINPNVKVDEMLGVLPNSKSLFKNKCFLLTCTAGLKPHLYSELYTLDQPRRNMQFSRIPFVRNHLEKQIENGGGKIYYNFNDIPKSKYRQCVLIAPRPCCTAKYIQCLAANIQAVSHEWIINSCKENILLKKNDYCLPAGWSILLNKFIKWSKGKSDDQRQHLQPFFGTYILIGSEHENFIKLWSNICKSGGAIIRYVKTLNDITPTTQGYLVIDSDFSDEIKRKAEHFGIPIVSSVWIVQSLIMGKVLSPNSHIKLSCIYSEDDDM